jgi:hypothetical protein
LHNFRRSWRVVIEKDVPMPPAQPGRTEAARVSAQMVAGDSVLCPTEPEARALQHALYRVQGKPKLRKVEGGWRVWRTA